MNKAHELSSAIIKDTEGNYYRIVDARYKVFRVLTDSTRDSFSYKLVISIDKRAKQDILENLLEVSSE